MKIDKIRKMRNRAPFRPFRLHMTNGEVLEVGHPENVSIPEDEEELFVVWTNHDWNLLETAQIARISTPKRAAKQG